MKSRQHIKKFFRTKLIKERNLRQLFDRYDRFYFIVTFIAVLVLAKDKEVEIIQDGFLKKYM